MDTQIGRRIRAAPEIIFSLAAQVENWPRILPHYRWVRLLDERGTERVVEMAARRDVVAHIGIPLVWKSVQRVNVDLHRIEFLHVAGLTRGMYVQWSIDAESGTDAAFVCIRHVFTPRWPIPDPLIHTIVGDYFVNGVAARTLRCIGDLAEASAAPARGMRPGHP